jgi:fructose-1,6-bisphosphatase/inositol monophosphatase family enzyme
MAEGAIKSKEMLSCDRDAELICRDALELSAQHENISIIVFGEESLWDTSIAISRKDPYVVLLDMVDGSDLLERGLGNWCSAAVIFRPKTGKIRASIVQDSNNNFYIATHKGAFFQEAKTDFVEVEGKVRCSIHLAKAIPLRGPHPPFEPLNPAKKDDRYASICFYAQKAKHFVRLPEGFRLWLNEFGFAGRLYTLAGNPMMAKLANGDRVHVVFEHLGQFAHDAVPGLYLALKAGAAIVRLDGSRISDVDLAGLLYTPSKENALQYVLATTEQLAKHVAKALAESPESFMYSCDNHKPPIKVSVRTIPKDGDLYQPQHVCGICGREMTRTLF